MESNLIEYLLTSMVIKRAIQLANAKNIDIEEGAQHVKAIDQIEDAVSELTELRPIVMKALNRS
jgi:hypothetical protein